MAAAGAAFDGLLVLLRRLPSCFALAMLARFLGGVWLEGVVLHTCFGIVKDVVR